MTFSRYLNLHTFLINFIAARCGYSAAVIHVCHCPTSHKILLREPQIAHACVEFTIRYNLTRFLSALLLPDDKAGIKGGQGSRASTKSEDYKIKVSDFMFKRTQLLEGASGKIGKTKKSSLTVDSILPTDPTIFAPTLKSPICLLLGLLLFFLFGGSTLIIFLPGSCVRNDGFEKLLFVAFYIFKNSLQFVELQRFTGSKDTTYHKIKPL